MPNVILSKKAESDFARLPNTERRKIIKKLAVLYTEPLSGKPLQGELAGFYSLRAWPYRIIYQFQKPNKVIVHYISHRQGAYR